MTEVAGRNAEIERRLIEKILRDEEVRWRLLCDSGEMFDE